MDGSDEEVFPASQIPKAAGSRDQAGSENRRVWTAQRERERSEFLEIDIGRQSVRGMRGINRIKRKVSFFFLFPT